MIFLKLFDGLLGFYVPILITDAGISKTAMGGIIGFSSVAGALFDFYLSVAIRSTHYRRFFLAMYIVATFYLSILMIGGAVPLFLLAMGLWGIYFDLMTFANHDYIARTIPKEKNTIAYAVLDATKSLGYAVAPPLSAFLIFAYGGMSIFYSAGIALIISLCFYIVMRVQNKSIPSQLGESKLIHKSPIHEMFLWKQTAVRMFIPLLYIFLLYMTESFFWVIGPLLSEDLLKQTPTGAFVLTAFFIPPIIMDWIAPALTARFGKKRTAFLSLLIASLGLILFFFINASYVILLTILLLSSSMTLGYPAIGSAINDYIRENPAKEHEIVGVSDFVTNLAYVLGPISAGFLADLVGNKATFGVWGIVACIVLIFLIPHARQDIKLRPH